MKLSLSPLRAGRRAHGRPRPHLPTPTRARSGLRLRVAVCAAVVAALSVVSCASDEVVAWQSPPADGGVALPQGDAGAAPALCGNAVLDDGEGCDDGNAASGDGCSDACEVESAPAGGCPGTAITLTAPSAGERAGSVVADTTGFGSSFDSATCGGGNGKDAVYSVTSDIAGRARVVLDAKFDAYLALRSICGDAKTESACEPVPVGGGKSQLVFPVAAGQTMFIVVDGVAGESGAFRLDVEIDATTCGDGVAQWPEQCDDANTTSGDGCSPACTLETPLSLPGKCPGATYAFAGDPSSPKTVSFAGDTSALASTASSLGCSSGGGKDQVYAITPTISGSLRSVLRASYPDAQLHARSECFTSQSQMDCREQPLAGVPFDMTIPVVANRTYYVFVDGSSGSGGGRYTLDVTLAPAACGNGVVDPTEECDDGDVADGDGCSAACALEPAPAGLDACPGAPLALAPAGGAGGDPLAVRTFRTTASTSLLTSGVEGGCGSGPATKDAVYSFVAPYDGWIDAQATGAFDVVLDLRADCVAESTKSSPGISCSDADRGNGTERVSGAIEAGETYTLVVKGGLPTADNEGPFTLEGAIRPAVCGDGIIEGGEECDDGGTDPGDTCDATCHIEPLSDPPTRTTCANAEPIDLTETTPGVYEASVVGGNWNAPSSAYFSAPCAGAGHEVFFTVTPPIDGIVVAKTVSSYAVSLGARPACPPSTSTGFITCSDHRTPAGESIAFAATAGTKYWIIVDAPRASDRGRFTLDVSVKGESCGDGLVSGAEQCDDGNVGAGDGCSPACGLEAVSGVDACPGAPLALTGTGSEVRSKVFTFSTAALSASTAGTCGGNSREGVVAVTSDVAGTARALLEGAWPSVLYARSACADGSTELDCDEADLAKPNATVREITFPIAAGVPAYVFVDGLSGGAGPATLSLTVTP
jgi:cysteine-rich repeat protein